MTATLRSVFCWQKLRLPARSALFFALFYLLVYLLIYPELVYHGVGQFVLYQVYVPGVTTVDQRGMRRVPPCDIGAYEPVVALYLPLVVRNYQ